MSGFSNWENYLINNASDPDKRKDEDPNEAPKHSINLDSYPEFLYNGYITQSLDTLIMLHGSSYVYDEGILPWAIINSYNSLLNYFINRDWKNAKQVTVDLAHYIGDCHMPFHIRKDYSYDELHQRFENDMIDKYAYQINFEDDTVSNIINIEDYVFKLLYKNYPYADSIINTDIFAQNFSGSKKSDLYFSTLWFKSKSFTDYLFSSAAKSLAVLIYTAWNNAGRPAFNSTSVAEEQYSVKDYQLFQNYPNPFNPSTVISYQLSVNSHLTLKVYDVLGNEIAVLVNEEKPVGSYEIEFSAASCGDGRNLSSGIYFYVLRVNDFIETRKMILIK